MTEFEWPCDRHEAHGPHPIDGTEYRRTRWGAIWTGSLPALNFVEHQTKPELNHLMVSHFQAEIVPGVTYSADALFDRVTGHPHPKGECPGVRAHPKTMIGGRQMKDDE